jgi:ankyrin repeat protein
MPTIWRAVEGGDLGELERLVGQDPGLLNAKNVSGYTPLIFASSEGRVEVVRWLLHKGAAVNEQDHHGITALNIASVKDRAPVVKLLLEGGGDPTIPVPAGWTPLMFASVQGHLEVVRFLLGHRGARATINQRNEDGMTALFAACIWGRGGGCEGAARERGRSDHRREQRPHPHGHGRA